MNKIGISLATIAAALLISTTTKADAISGVLDLVGGVVDTVGYTVETVTGGDVAGLISANNGPASSDAVVNLGLGDGGSRTGNVLDLNVGKKVVQTTVRRNGGTVNGTVNLLGGNSNTLLAGLDLDGLGLNLGIGIGGIGGGGGSNGPGGPGNGNGPGGGSGGSGGGLSLGIGQTDCSVDMGKQILQIAANGKFTSSAAQRWQRSSNVNVVQVKVCASTKRQLAQILGQSGKVQALRNAAASDALIATSLSRGKHKPSDVFAVDNTGGQLTVYVY